MLTISGVSKMLGGRTLFSDVALQVNREDRMGLVGPNGAGKTTFFSLLLGQAEPDAGAIIFERGITVGNLPQESAPVGEETVLELSIAISPEMTRLQRIIAREEAGEELDPHEITEAHAQFAELGGHQLIPKAKRILKGLSFREKDFNRPARELSGGWVMRAHLARLLVQEPDLLILDEPTNHLDLESLIWFQEYLKNYSGAILMISHDREFLNQLVTQIVEIRQGAFIRYRGNYNSYLEQRAAADAQQLAAFKNQQREIDRLQTFADRFRAKASKAAQAQSKLKQIERMDKIEAPVDDAKGIHFNFPQPKASGIKPIELENIHFAYGENHIYRGMNFEVERGQRIVLVGPNGAGKSTLLKLLAGVLTPQQGERLLGHNAKSGYFAQYRADVLDITRTVIEEASDTPQRVTEEYIRTILGAFLFRGDDVFKKVSVLSGGEKSRLALVKLLLDPPNLLLMDEPTTHLDMASIEALIAALEQFSGTVVFISHDVYFIRELANFVVHVNAGKLTTYPGGYQYYLDKTAATSARAALTAGAEAKPKAKPAQDSGLSRKEQRRIEAEARNARSKERKEKQQAVHDFEKQIAALEAKQTALTAELESSHGVPGRANQINRELVGIMKDLERLTAKWEAASQELTAEEEAAGA